MTEPRFKKQIFICTNERPENNPRGDCKRCGGMEIRLKMAELIKEHGLKGEVRANKSGCLDVCEMGAALVVYPANIWYTQVKLDDVQEIFETSVLNDGIVERLAATKETWAEFEQLRK